MYDVFFKKKHISRHLHKSENLDDLKRDKDFGNSSCSRLRLPSPSSKKKQKKKFKKDSKKQPSRLLQERCVHCHELFSEVLIETIAKYSLKHLYFRRTILLDHVDTLQILSSRVLNVSHVLLAPSVFSITVITRTKILQVKTVHLFKKTVTSLLHNL